MTIREMIDSIETLQLILDKPMKARLSYKIARIIEEVEKENLKYINIRKKLIEKYGEYDDNNNLIKENEQYKIATEKISSFNEELLELLNTKISFLLNEIELNDIETLELSPRQILKIKNYIKKEEA